MKYLQVKITLHNWDKVKSTVGIANEMMGLKLADDERLMMLLFVAF